MIGTKRIGIYNHIYPMGRLKNGQWVGIEATIPGAAPFFAPRSTTVRAMDVPNISGLNAGEQLPPGMPRGRAATVKDIKSELGFVRWTAYAALGLSAILVINSFRRIQWRAA